jgi:Single Cache domain 2
MRHSDRFLPALFALMLVGAAPAAAPPGTAADARAMLDRAVAALRANEPTAIAAFNSATGGFRQGDLYVFCATLNGRVDAHVDPAQIGRHIQDVYDIDGVALGREIMAVAREGEVAAVEYEWPRPTTHEPAQKVTFVTRVAGHVCGVGYYK